MRKKFPRSLLMTVIAVAPIGGCTVGPDFHKPTAEVPPAWSAQSKGASISPADDVGAWWIKFNDPELTSLITRAMAANLDAKQAALRITEARAQRSISGATQWPTLTANASGMVNRLSETTPTGDLFSKVGNLPGLTGVSIPNPYDQYQVGFDASWELDLFGRVRRSVEAADADTQASIEDSRAVRISVLGDVGRAYVDLRAAQARHQIALDTIATEREFQDLARQRQRSGLSSDIDAVRAEAEAASAQAQLPLLDERITLDINQLSKLIAREPGALKAELSSVQSIPSPPSIVAIGIPADLARRRPDIREAEARLHGATARVGVAVADLYPKLTLGVQGGVQSESISSLANWASRFLTAGPTLLLPIFDGGRLRATVRLQDVREQEAALSYRGTVLTALHEVDNALASYGADQARQLALLETVAHDRDAVALVQQRYQAGIASFIDVLDAERTLEQNEILLTDGTAAISTDLIILYKSIGGGWQ